MTPNITTIITPIVDGQLDALKDYLALNANPELHPRNGGLQCKPAFRFDQIPGLHFCSFLVLDADTEEKIPAKLVFEATFDGSRDEFLNELISIAPAGMRSVYQHCVGYPQCGGHTVLELVKTYLVEHDVGADTFYSGSPGRSVCQIKRESRLRAEMVDYLSTWRQSSCAMPPTHDLLRRRLQNDVIVQQPHNDWARKAAEEPWELRWRTSIIRAAKWALGGAAVLLGCIILYLSGIGPYELKDLVRHLREWSDWAGEALVRMGWKGPVLPVLYGLIALSVAWFAVRIVELLLRSSMVDPRKEFLRRRYFVYLLFITRYAILFFLVTFATLALLAAIEPPIARADSVAPAAKALSDNAAAEIGRYKEILGNIEMKVGKADPADQGPSWRVSLLIAALAIAGLVVLGYFATSLKLAAERELLEPKAECWRRYGLDVIVFFKVLLLLAIAFAIARHLPDWASAWLAWSATAVWWVIVGGVYLLVGVLAVMALILLAFLVVTALERRDMSHFEPAVRLNERAFDNPEARAREEGGINTYQNHLASLTYVKGGPLRRWLLRSTLWLINLLSRFYFNEGKLGDIPTILSARWVVIDGGRRLIFLDNYGGGWESYLNEFIDLSAVRGLNAIWTNTFIKCKPAAPEATVAGETPDPCKDPKTRYAFPWTRSYLWRGAEAERPFKAYVRASQIETIAWYGAYHTLSITNINDNSRLRQSLFMPRGSCELDAMFQQM